MKDFIMLEVKSSVEKSLRSFFSKKVNVIMFICNHCPYVKHINQELVKLSNDFIPQGINFLAINSNDPIRYPEDSPEKMKIISKKLNYPFPYFFDEKQEVAKYFGAKCTPEFFIFYKEDKLCYRGQFDDSRPNNQIPITGNDIRNTLKNIIDEKFDNFPILKNSVGCSIKWKS